MSFKFELVILRGRLGEVMEFIPSNIDVKDNSIAIVGWHEGLAGQIHSWLEKSSNYHIACFINPTDEIIEVDPNSVKRDAKNFSYPTRDSFKGRPLLTSLNWVPALQELRINKVLVTTDDPHLRWQQIKNARQGGMKLVNAVHPSSLIMEEAVLEDNVILLANAFVGYRSELYTGVIINTGAQVDHHNVIKACANIYPGVICAGNVIIERFARIYTGAKLINRISVGENAIIGAGAVIIKDVPGNVTIVGIPGKVIKHQQL